MTMRRQLSTTELPVRVDMASYCLKQIKQFSEEPESGDCILPALCPDPVISVI